MLPVAVVIPSFRRKQFLARALRSVVAQRGARPVEVIVVDDGSRDGTADVARSFGARVIEKPDNQGRPLARQDGLMGAEGAEWVAMLDDDDEWLPDHLLTLWSKRGGHVMVAGTSLSQGGGRPRSHGATSAAGEVVRSPARLMFPENSFTTSAVMVRRDILLAAGGFDPGVPLLEDLDAWLRVLELGTGLLLPDVTCLYTVHSSQVSHEREAMKANNDRVIEKYRDRPWLTASVLEGAATISAWDDLQAARTKPSRGEIWEEATAFLQPARLSALARLLHYRWRVRRRSEQLRATPGLCLTDAGNEPDG